MANERKDEPPRSYAVDRCIQAWDELDTERAIGMALGPIPVSKIRAWCVDNELEPEAADLIKHVIRKLDHDRAAAEAARRATEQATGPARARGRTA